MLAGCIPVILSDNVVLPFEGIHNISWDKFSVKWPQDCIHQDLYRWLLDLGRTRGAAIKAALDEVACWFDYHGPSGGHGLCNAFAATLAALKSPFSRAASFWN